MACCPFTGLSGAPQLAPQARGCTTAGPVRPRQLPTASHGADRLRATGTIQGSNIPSRTMFADQSRTTGAIARTFTLYACITADKTMSNTPADAFLCARLREHGPAAWCSDQADAGEHRPPQ